MAVDSLLGKVVFLAHFNGADAGTVFTDRMNNPITRGGTATTSTTTPKYGTASLLLNGTTDYLTVPMTSAMALGTGDFTIEFWMNSANTTQVARLFSFGRAIATDDMQDSIIVYQTTTALLAYARTDAAAANWDVLSAQVISPTVPTANVWHHVAITREGGLFRTFYDGALGSSIASGAAIAAPSGLMRIGVLKNTAPLQFYNGKIDDVRITVGVARYTAAFTGSLPTEFPDEGPGSITAIVPSAPTISSYGGGYVAIAAPSPTMVIYGGGSNLTITAPMGSIYSAVHESIGENEIVIAAPSPTLLAYGGSNAAITAPTPTLTATATVSAMADIAIDAPMGTIASTATVSEMASIAVTAPMARLIGYGGAVCSITLTGAPTIQATGTMGGVAQIAITAPLYQLTSTATAQNHGSLIITAPMGKMVSGIQAYITAPMATLTAIGTATITATYEAYALNLHHRDPNAIDELTRYTNFPFTHVVRYQNSYYGVAAGALYLLEGTTDNATPIQYTVQTAKTDFDVPEMKAVPYAYFGGRMGPGATVSIVAGEQTPEVYSYTTPRGQTAQNYRQSFGRGIGSRYYAFGVSGSDVLELDSLDIEHLKLTRRI